MDTLEPEQVKREPLDQEVSIPIEKPKEEKKEQEGGRFLCALCGWSELYHAHGTSLPFARGIVFNEDAYAMRDPFVPYGPNLYLFIGAPCSVCQRLVCVNCSIFYAKRFCRECATSNVEHFPVEVQKKIRELEASHVKNKSE